MLITSLVNISLLSLYFFFFSTHFVSQMKFYWNHRKMCNTIVSLWYWSKSFSFKCRNLWSSILKNSHFIREKIEQFENMRIEYFLMFTRALKKQATRQQNSNFTKFIFINFNCQKKNWNYIGIRNIASKWIIVFLIHSQQMIISGFFFFFFLVSCIKNI